MKQKGETIFVPPIVEEETPNDETVIPSTSVVMGGEVKEEAEESRAGTEDVEQEEGKKY